MKDVLVGLKKLNIVALSVVFCFHHVAFAAEPRPFDESQRAFLKTATLAQLIDGLPSMGVVSPLRASLSKLRAKDRRSFESIKLSQIRFTKKLGNSEFGVRIGESRRTLIFKPRLKTVEMGGVAISFADLNAEGWTAVADQMMVAWASERAPSSDGSPAGVAREIFEASMGLAHIAAIAVLIAWIVMFPSGAVVYGLYGVSFFGMLYLSQKIAQYTCPKCR